MRALLRLSLHVLLLTALVSTARAQQSRPLPLKDWVDPPVAMSLKLSPDGKRVAGIEAMLWPMAVVTNLDDKKRTVVARRTAYRNYVYGRFPVNVHWIDNDLLAIDYSTNDSVSVDLSGRQVAELGERFVRPMFEKGTSGSWVLAYRDLDDGDLHVVNARTGEKTKFTTGLKGRMVHGAFDAAGVLRAVTMVDSAFWSDKTMVSNWYRPDERSEWQLLEEAPIAHELWRPLRALAEPDSLVVYSRHGRDTWAVFRYDTKTRQHVELMAGHPAEDIAYVQGLDSDNFEVVMTAGIKPKISWFDGRWAGLQQAVDAALPGRINLLQGNKDDRVLVYSYGDVDPGRWFLLETKTSKMREIEERRIKIDPTRMRPMETVQYAARDGMTINAYVTKPAPGAAGPAPMIVLIHGGPHVRDDWEWNEEVQLLASRGYVVFQPQFRGSSGFGRRFEEAGHRKWGREMQDDITDGVRHLVAENVADPQRICIYGASYGGYAALWGVVKTPDLYQCGASFAGVSDLADWVSHSFMDDSTAAVRELHRSHIGDPKQDRAQLDEVSPLKHADRITVPLLIAHGEEDTRVLPSQSKAMVKALRGTNKSVEWLSFAGEGHGLAGTGEKIRYYTALLAFFQRHIGGGEAPAPVGAKAPQ